jgi:AraC family transcriptional regulator
MLPRIQTILPKKLIGKRLKMSFADYRIEQLWKSFSPRRKEIVNYLTNDLISMAIYPKNHFTEFRPDNEFERWATAEVSDFNMVLHEMETYILPGGLYAVFHHQGDAKEFFRTMQFIFETWLPDSGYELDDRPHFEILSEKYKNNDSGSEEEIWIPVKSKIS